MGNRVLMGSAAVGVSSILLDVAAWELHDSRTTQLFGRFVPRVETSDSTVALTFDDGPEPGRTQEVIAILADAEVPATFFLVGSEVEKYPEEAQHLIEAGFEIGNHSFTHRTMMLRRPGSLRREIEQTDSVLRAVGYEGPIHFRVPYGKRLLLLPLVLERMGRTHVMWDVEPESFPEIARDSARIVQHVLAEVRPGSIILMHPFYPGRETTRRALPAVIEALRGQGYEFATVSDLMGTADQATSEAIGPLDPR